MLLLVIRIFAALSLLLSTSSFAKTDYLPPAKTQAELSEQAAKIRNLLPFSQYTNASYMQIQHQGLAALQKQFPDFDKWAAEKLDPITIHIETRAIANQMSLVLKDEIYRDLREQVFRQLEADAASKNFSTTQALQDITIQRLGESLLGGADSLRGLITGVLQVLPKEKKGAIFKAGEPAVQLQLLRESNLTDDLLRSGAFQGERFGLDSKTMTVQEVFSLIEKKLNSNQEVLIQLGVWSVLKRASGKEVSTLKKISDAARDKLLFASDFDFLEGAEKKSVLQIQSLLAQAFPKAQGKIEKAFESSLATVPKQWFEKKLSPTEVLRPYAKLVEVHPYLGVFRGCAGGDCSTSHSPMYPYSPWEHVFYIVMADGSFVGYVSSTIIESGGKSALYLKDITGARLSPDMGELVMHAFGEVYKYFQVDKLTLAAAEFTDAENHHRILFDRYAHYNGRLAPKNGGPKVVMEPTRFLDTEIRNFIYGNPAIFYSGQNYDLPQRHRYAAIFAPQIDMSGYRVSYKVETLGAFKPKSTKESVIYAMRMINADEKADISQVPDINEDEVRRLLVVLKNERKSNLKDFYAEVTNAFANFGIEFSRSFRQDYENFFIRGHLQAIDAFTTADPTLISDSEKYLVLLARRYKDLDFLTTVAKLAVAKFANSERIVNMIHLFRDRAEEIDIDKLIVFASAGYTEAQAVFRNPEFQKKAEEALIRYLQSKRDDDKIERRDYNSLSLFRKYYIRTKNAYTYEQMLLVFDKQLGFMNLSIEKLQNPNLKNIVTELLMQTEGFYADPKNNKVIIDLLERGKKTSVRLYHSVILSIRVYGNNAKNIGEILLHRWSTLQKIGFDTPEAALEAYWIRSLVDVGNVTPNYRSQGSLALYQAWREGDQKKSNFKNEFLQEFFNQFSLSIIGKSYVDGLIKNFSYLESHLQNPERFAAQLNENPKLLDVTLRNLDMGLGELLEIPEFRRAYELFKASGPQAFIDPSYKEKSYRSLLTEIEKLGDGTDLLLRNLIAAKASVAGSKELFEFQRQLMQIIDKSQNEMALGVLASLIKANMMDQKIDLGPRVLQKLSRSQDPLMQVYAVDLLLKRFPEVRIEDAVLRSISKLLNNESKRLVSDQQLIYSERAMDVLYRVRTQDEEVQKELRVTYKEEDNLKMVLKAAIAWIRNGGDPEKVRKYVKSAFKEFPNSDDKSAEMKALKKEYGTVVGKEPDAERGSCQALFR